jgi:FecR-like protein
VKLVGRVHVEPLDDERWTNIERRVVTGASDAAARGVDRAARSSGLAWALAVAGVAVIALVAGAIGWRMHAPEAGRALIASSELGTLRLDGGVLDIGDARIASDARAAYSITREGGGVQVRMQRGRVELEVGKRGARPPLVVEAGDTDVIVVGTHFSVAYDPDTGAVDVRVTEGVVRVVRKHHDEARVAAGQQWSSGGGLVATAEPTAPKPAPAQVEPPKPKPQPQPPSAAQATAPSPVADAGSIKPRPAAAAGSDARIDRADRADDPHLDLKTRIRAAPLLAPLDVGTTDPTAAIDAYTRIFTSDTGQRAAHALYSIAWVQYSRQGRASDALIQIDRIVKRFENIEYRAQYAAALWLRVRIRCLGAGIDDACRHAAYIYLHQAPDGAAAALAEDITLAH